MKHTVLILLSSAIQGSNKQLAHPLFEQGPRKLQCFQLAFQYYEVLCIRPICDHLVLKPLNVINPQFKVVLKFWMDIRGNKLKLHLQSF